MRDLENALREAMADDVAGIVSPPDLAEQVRLRHLQHRRIWAVAALGAVAAIVLLVPVAMAAVPRETGHPPVAPAPTADEVDGVRVTYVPEGLVRDPVDGVDFGDGTMTEVGWTGWTARTGRWHPASGIDRTASLRTGLRVTVFRGGPPVADLASLAKVAFGLDPATVQLRPDGSRLLFRTDVPPKERWRGMMWRVGEGSVLLVRISDDLEHELEPVVQGVKLDGPGGTIMVDAGREPPPAAGGVCEPATNFAVMASRPPSPDWDRFGGVSVGYVPEELAPGGFSDAVPTSGLSEELTRWSYSYRWRLPGEKSDAMRVAMYCGQGLPEFGDELRDFLSSLGTHGLEPVRYPVLSPGAAYVIDSHLDGSNGRTVAWFGNGGVVVVSVVEELAEQLDHIVTGVGWWFPGVSEPVGAGCGPPELLVRALPWLDEEGPMPMPEQVRLETGSQLDRSEMWSAQTEGEDPFSGPFVTLTRVHDPQDEPGQLFGFHRRVRDHPAEEVWIGELGASEVTVSWREAPGLCGVYRLSLNTAGLAPMLGEQWAPGGRCEPAVADQACQDELRVAVDAELDRILGSLTEQG